MNLRIKTQKLNDRLPRSGFTCFMALCKVIGQNSVTCLAVISYTKRPCMTIPYDSRSNVTPLNYSLVVVYLDAWSIIHSYTTQQISIEISIENVPAWLLHVGRFL